MYEHIHKYFNIYIYINNICSIYIIVLRRLNMLIAISIRSCSIDTSRGKEKRKKYLQLIGKLVLIRAVGRDKDEIPFPSI